MFSHIAPAQDTIEADTARRSRENIPQNLSRQLPQVTFYLNDRCTACLISPRGLLLTTRHCLEASLSQAQPYQDEFWAADLSGERPLPRVTLRRQISDEDITTRILQGLRGDESPRIRQSHIEQKKLQILLPEKNDKYHFAEIRESQEGLRFQLIRWEIYDDVRLVGLPQAIDEASDFALLRIYAPENKDQAQNFATFLPLDEDLPTPGQTLFSAGFPSYSDYHHSSSSFANLILAPLQTRIQIDSTLLARTFPAGKTDNAIYTALQKRRSEHRQLRRALREYRVIPLLQQRENRQLAAGKSPAQAIRLWETMNQAARELGELQVLSTYAEQPFRDLPAYQRAKVLSAILRGRPPGEPFAPEYYQGKLPAILKQFPESDRKKSEELVLLKNALEIYFGQMKAQYLSPEVIEQVTALEKNYDLLAEILFTESLLFQPGSARKMVMEDLAGFVQKLEKDVGFRFFGAMLRGHEERLYPLRSARGQAFREARRQYLALLQKDSIPLPYDANGTLRLGQGTVQKGANGAVIHTRINRNQAERLGDRSLQEVPNTFVNNLPFTRGAAGSPLVDAQGRLLGIHLDWMGAGWASDYIYDPARQRNVALSAVFVQAYLAGKEAGRRLLREME